MTELPGTGPDEREREILRERARQLGTPRVEEERRERIEVLRFTLAQEHYAVQIEFMEEVVPFQHLTPVPCTPSYVMGAVSRRGRVLAVVDLKRFFGLPERGLVDLNRVVVLSDGTMEFGVMADEVIGVQHVLVSRLGPAPATLTGIGRNALLGVTPQMLIVLDGAGLLSDPRMVVNEDVQS
mgnify:CR=1 FL=1